MAESKVPKGFIPDEPQVGEVPPGFIPDAPATAPQPPHSGYDTMDRIRGFQGAVDKAATTEPYTGPGSRPGIGGAIHTTLNNLGAGATKVFQPLVHPLDTLNGISKMAGAATGDAGDAYDIGTSMVRPFVERPGAESVAALPQLAMAFAGGGRAAQADLNPSGIPLRPFDALSEYRSPAISTSEAIGRRTADILHPNPMAYRGVSQAVAEHAPYIKDFAASTGNKFRTPLDFSKAATGAGQEASNFFKSQFIEPNAEFQTPHGTVQEISQRLSDINDQLRPAYRQRTGGQELTALERKGLEEERDKLNETLFGTLSERSGLPTEKIQGIYQRGGALQHVGDEADAAQAMRRSGFSGYTPSGLPIPMGGLERAMRLVNYVRGGPERVAGRQLGRVFENVKEAPESLPDTGQIQNYRRMAEQSDLGNLRRVLEEQGQNQANSGMRRQVWRNLQ